MRRPSASMPPSRSRSRAKSSVASGATQPCTKAKETGAARKPKAEATPAPAGATMRARPSFMPMWQACTGPAPPIGTIA